LTAVEAAAVEDAVRNAGGHNLTLALAEVTTWKSEFLKRKRGEPYSVALAALFDLLMTGHIVLRVIGDEVRIFPVASA
jgi:hypothetical protein